MILIDLDAEARHAHAVIAAGEWARWYVIGALDPRAVADVWEIVARLRTRPDLLDAFTKGLDAREEPASIPLAWSRDFGATRVEVSAA